MRKNLLVRAEVMITLVTPAVHQYGWHYLGLKRLEVSSLKVPNLEVVSTLEVSDLVLHLPQFGNLHLVFHYVLFLWSNHSSCHRRSSSSGRKDVNLAIPQMMIHLQAYTVSFRQVNHCWIEPGIVTQTFSSQLLHLHNLR